MATQKDNPSQILPLKTKDPATAKAIGEGITVDSDRSNNEEELMEKMMTVKAATYPEYRDALKASGKARLKHNVGSKKWGTGLDQK